MTDHAALVARLRAFGYDADGLFHEAAEALTAPAPLPTGIHPCPTCDRAGCTRCHGLGRQQCARLYADDTHGGRAKLQLWFGAPGTMELVADTDPELTLAHERVNLILATLAEAPGVIIRDRRAPR